MTTPATGAWTPIHASDLDDRQKVAAAEMLVSEAHIPAKYALALVLSWCARLSLHCLARGDDGTIGDLSDVRLATIAWPEGVEDGRSLGRSGAMIRRVLTASGLIVGSGVAAGLPDFTPRHARVLADRVRKREDRKAAKAKNQPPAPVASVDASADASVDAWRYARRILRWTPGVVEVIREGERIAREAIEGYLRDVRQRVLP